GARPGLGALFEVGLVGFSERLRHARVGFRLHERGGAVGLAEALDERVLLRVGVHRRILAAYALPHPEVRPVTAGGFGAHAAVDAEQAGEFGLRSLAAERSQA